jgi:hypothetical protein
LAARYCVVDTAQAEDEEQDLVLPFLDHPGVRGRRGVWWVTRISV